MAAQLIEVAGHKLLTGLVWRNVLNVADKGELARNIEEAKARYYVRLTKPQTTFVGMIPNEKKVPAGAMSLAALFALQPDIPSSSLLFLDLPKEAGGGTAMVGISKGMPEPGYDVVGDRKTMMELQEEFVALNNSSVTVYSNTKAFQNAIPFDFDDLFQGVPVKKTLPIRYRPGLGRLVPLVAAVMVLGAGAAGYIWYEHDQDEQRALQAKQKDPVVQYRQSLSVALQTVGVRPKDFVANVLPRIVAQPNEIAGWHLESVECKATECNSTWAKDFGTNRSFAEAFPKAQLTFSPEGGKLSVKAPLGVTIKPMDQGGMVKQQEFFLTVGSQFQKWAAGGLTYRMMAPTLFGGATGGADAIPGAVFAGQWEASGSLWMLPSLGSLPDSVTIDLITLRRTANDVTFNVRGMFYVTH